MSTTGTTLSGRRERTKFEACSLADVCQPLPVRMTMSSSVQAKSLPAMLYLLGIDVDKEKLPEPKKISYVLRAGALVELVLRGNLTDVDGKAHPVSEAATGDPVLDLVMGEVAKDRGQRWSHWIRHDARATLKALEDQLSSTGAIKMQRRMLLGDKVEVVDQAAHSQLRQQVLATLTGGAPVETLGVKDVALTALTAYGELTTAIPHKQRRAHKDRLKALTEHAGPSAPVVKKLADEIFWLKSSGHNGGAIAAANAR